eukprot:Hpha_TRINITY_DN27815_c0_g1::TRINITY_DN27815_c0_g1_i1::g.194026::m.194026
MDDVWDDAAEGDLLQRDRRINAERLAAAGYHDGMDAAAGVARERCAPVFEHFSEAAAVLGFAAGVAEAEAALRGGQLKTRSAPPLEGARDAAAAGTHARRLLQQLARVAQGGAFGTVADVQGSNLGALRGAGEAALRGTVEAAEPRGASGQGVLCVAPGLEALRAAIEALALLESQAKDTPQPSPAE